MQFSIGNRSHAVRNEANGSNALGRNRSHDEYSPGLASPFMPVSPMPARRTRNLLSLSLDFFRWLMNELWL